MQRWNYICLACPLHRGGEEQLGGRDVRAEALGGFEGVIAEACCVTL